jgi:hypothetical protein
MLQFAGDEAPPNSQPLDGAPAHRRRLRRLSRVAGRVRRGVARLQAVERRAGTRGPYERPRLSKDYLRGEAGRERVYVHGEGFYADHDIELHLGRTAVDMNTTLQEIALDVMPQQDDGIPVAEHPLERSAS